MSSLDRELDRELEALRRAGLARTTEQPEIGADFTSNDTLGLARHPAVIEAACRAAREHGAGARAARLLGGGSPIDAVLEAEVAEWLGAEAALLFPSGYQANLGLVTALVGPGDAIVSDEYAHASLIDACRLSGARLCVFRHGDLEHAEHLLADAAAARRRLIVTEGVFSMDGDAAPLAELAELALRRGAVLIVDEAHAAGLLGPGGAGAWSATAGADPAALAARVVTGGKALGVAGALVVGSRALRELLVHRARTFVFTTAPPPAVAGALREAVRLARGMERERARVRAAARALATRLALPRPAAAIVPVVLGSSETALAAAERLRARGLAVRAVRPPTVPAGTARLRVVVHAGNSDEELERLAEALAEERIPVRGVAAEPRAPARAPALCVAGTDTGVGKTVVSALLAVAASTRGPVRYWKPVQTGGDDDTGEVARLAAGAAVRCAEPLVRLPLPASPHEAAAAARTRIDPQAILERLEALRRAEPDEPLVFELAGGLLVPLDEHTTQADLLARAQPPLVLVARTALGTLNHTLLSLEALRARRIVPRALLLVGAPHPSNERTLRDRARVPLVLHVPFFEPLGPAALARFAADHPSLAELARR